MWKVVEEAMRNGQAALEELQERRPEKSQEVQPEKQKQKTAKEKKVERPEPRPAPRTAKAEEPKKKSEAAPNMELNRRQRRARGIFNEKGPAGSGETGEDFFA